MSNLLSTQTKAGTSRQVMPAREGVLQRNCGCGQHTIAGGDCAECGKNKNSVLHKSTNQRAGAGFPVPSIPVIQRKLSIGAANDPLELEADRVAESVMSAATHSAVTDAAPRIQRSSGQTVKHAGTVPSTVDRVLASPGRPMNAALQEDMERRFGYDFSRVRVHSGGAAEQSAREISADAYTVGHNIVFGGGRFAPEMREGRRLIAHELAHVVQQSQSRAVATVLRAVNPTTVNRLDHDALIGDGTAINPGKTLSEFEGYISQQADWFVEPTLSDDDRRMLWRLALLLQENDYIGAGLANLPVARLGAAKPAQMKAARAYAAGAATAAQTVRITRPDGELSRVVELGEAMVELEKFVPGPVLRVCINQTGLEKMVDESLVPTLSDYYKAFSPTIENPAEQNPLLTLLRGGLAPFKALADWVHDLHVFTPPTRVRLAANVKDKTRSKPVLLVLMTGLDWNAAFQQATNLEAAVLNNKNLALVIQGPTSLVSETKKLNKTADDYGQIPKAGAKGQLGQVVIAGHGQSTTVGQATPGTGAKSKDDKYVSYDRDPISPANPGDDSELLIDALLQRMNPADARVVFAGCLVGSHDIPETPTLANTKTAAAEINAAIKAKPNLRDLVYQRMAALKIKGTVQASNASTTFGAFNLEASGKAQLRLSWDPDVGGSKESYVKTGAEPEGALRAALETWADPKLGPTWTTTEMRKHVTATAASNDWWVSLTRTAFQLALPAAGDVDPSVINNLAHRVEAWLLAGWDDSAKPGKLAKSVRATEAPVLYPVMLASDHATKPHLGVVVQQAWMDADASHETDFLNAIGATTLTRTQLTPLVDDSGIVKPHLLALLKATDPKKPSRSQLLLGLLIAVARGKAMPAEVQTFLSNAAGGVRTTTFPAAAGVTAALLDGASELAILENIGLAPGAQAPVGIAAAPDDANVDLDQDKINETFVTVKPRRVTLASSVYVRTRPNRDPASKVMRKLDQGDLVRVVGTTGTWSMIDVGGKVGFIERIFP